jgi:hypothetical protein
MERVKVMYASDEAAQKVTVTGWRSRAGRFYGDNEHLARWDGCTHQICDCGVEIERGWTKCHVCRQKNRLEKYEAMPFKEWDGETMLTLHDDDKYFRDEDELMDYCEMEEIPLEELHLVICEPQYAHQICEDYYSDLLPEDMTLDDCYSELAQAIEKVNELIRKKEKPISWSGGKFRTSIKSKDIKP